MIDEIAVSFFVREEAGVDRGAWPVTAGVPLPHSAAYVTEAMVLMSGEAPVPCQMTAKSHWPNGSIRWVILDFRVDLKANERKDFVLSASRFAACDRPDVELPTVSKKRGAASIEDGLCVWQLAGGAPSFRAIEPGVRLRVSGFVGKGEDQSWRMEGIQVEEQGFSRVSVLMQGRPRSRRSGKPPVFFIRVDAFPGLHMARIETTLLNDSTEPKAMKVPEFGLTVDWDSPKGEGPASVKVGRLGCGVWADLTRQGVDCHVAVPQGRAPALKVCDGGVRIGLGLDGEGSEDERTLGVGMAHRQEVWIQWAQESAVKGPAFLTACQNPLWAVVPTSEHARVMALGCAIPATARLTLEWQRCFDALFQEALKDSAHRPRPNGHGVRSEGPHWARNDLDLLHPLALEFLRTGRTDLAAAARCGTECLVDVDLIRAAWPKIQGTSKMPPRDPSLLSQACSWVPGLLAMHCLTGDPWCLKVGFDIADWAEGLTRAPGYAFEMDEGPFSGRLAGYALWAFSSALMTTSHDRYLRASHKLVRLIGRRQDAVLGTWPTTLSRELCQCRIRHKGMGLRSLGILLNGLIEFHRISGHEPLTGMVVKAAHAIVANQWQDEAKVFRASECPKSPSSPIYASAALRPILYAYHITRDESLWRVATRAWQSYRDHVLGGHRVERREIAALLAGVPEALYLMEKVRPIKP